MKGVFKKTVWVTALAVVVPLVALAIPARIADVRYETSPWLLVAAIFVAMHVTLAILIWRFRTILSTLKNSSASSNNSSVNELTC